MHRRRSGTWPGLGLHLLDLRRGGRRVCHDSEREEKRAFERDCSIFLGTTRKGHTCIRLITSYFLCTFRGGNACTECYFLSISLFGVWARVHNWRDLNFGDPRRTRGARPENAPRVRLKAGSLLRRDRPVVITFFLGHKRRYTQSYRREEWSWLPYTHQWTPAEGDGSQKSAFAIIDVATIRDTAGCQQQLFRLLAIVRGLNARYSGTNAKVRVCSHRRAKARIRDQRRANTCDSASGRQQRFHRWQQSQTNSDDLRACVSVN